MIYTFLFSIAAFIFLLLTNSSGFKITSNDMPSGNPLGNTPYSITAYYHDKSYFKIFHKEHTGIDLIPIGKIVSPVYLFSTIKGESYIVDDKCSGEAIIVKSSKAIIYYGHISQALIKDGSEVFKGEKIAIMGESGKFGECVTGIHLHYQIYLIENRKNIIVDPLPYLTASFP